MAATIIETEERHEDKTQFDSLEPQEEVVEEQAPVEASQEDTEEEIPEKYQGKSVADIVRMHQEAEKLLGRQSSEVGELRKVVDSYIQTQLSNEAPETEEEIDFFDDPKEAVRRAVDNHPKIKEAEQMSMQYRQADTVNKLTAEFPDFVQTVQDSGFQEWIKASKIRTQLYQQADQQFDYDSAKELLSTWNERQQSVKQTAEAEKKSRKDAVKEASTGNVRGTGETSKKIYRRSDIIKLMKTDPDRYQALSDEIMTAYREGRVK